VLVDIVHVSMPSDIGSGYLIIPTFMYVYHTSQCTVITFHLMSLIGS